MLCNCRVHVWMWCFEAWSDIYSSAKWLHRCFGMFGVDIIPTFPWPEIAFSACTSELQYLRRWEAGLCSPSRDFHQQLATIRVNRPKHCEPGRRLWGETEGVLMPQMGWVCWIIFVLSFVTMQEVTATSRHYVDRLFDPDPQNVLQGVMWVNNHVSLLVCSALLCVIVHHAHFLSAKDEAVSHHRRLFLVLREQVHVSYFFV